MTNQARKQRENLNSGNAHTDRPEKITIGWREWVSFPQLGIPAIKAKVDTGARTSALHAFELEPFEENGVAKVRFGIHPLQKRRDIELHCVADIIDERIISDSGGHRERRYVIQTPIQVGQAIWDVELTLTNRDTMIFRMLLGRTAMHQRLIVDPTRSYVMGRKLRRIYIHEQSSSKQSPSSST